MLIITGKEIFSRQATNVEKLDLLLQIYDYIIYIVDMGC